MLKGNRIILPIDVIKYLLKNWIKVVICTLVIAVIFTGYSFYKDKKAVQRQNQKDIEAKEYNIDEFTEEELNTAQNAIDAYNILVKTQNYYDNSYIQKVDPFGVHQTTLYYKVEIDMNKLDPELADQANNYAASLRTEYYYYVQRGDLGTDIAERLEIDPQYITELVSIENDGNVAFSLLLKASDIVPDFAETTKNVLIDYGKELEKKYPKHSVTLNDEYEAVIRIDDYYNRQKNSTSEINACSNNLTGLLNKLDKKQIAFYNSETGNEYEYIDPDTKEPEPKYQTIGKKGLIKKGVIGVAIGLIASCVVGLLIYMYSPTIVSDSDYIYSLGMTLFGTSREEMDKKLAIEKVKNACKVNQINKLIITSTNKEHLESDVAQTLMKELKGNGIEADIMNDCLNDSDKMKHLLEIGNIVLVEGVGKSKLMKINEVVDLCTDCKVNLLGVIDISTTK